MSIPRVALVAVVLSLGLFSGAHAANKFWSATPGDANWSTGGNWGGTAPVNDDALLFSSSTILTTNNDIAGLSVQLVRFLGPNSFVLGGNDLDLSSSFGIINDSSVLQTINLNLTGNTITFNRQGGLGDGNIQVNGALSSDGLVNNTTANAGATATTLAGSISGAAIVRNSAASATLALTGSNDYSGGTEVLAGTLIIGHTNALGTGTLNVTNATVVNNADFTIANAAAVTGDATFNTAGNLTLNGNVTGAGQIIKTGAGTLALTASNGYTGGTTVGTGGALVYAATGALGTGDLTLTDGAISTVGFRSLLNNVVLTGTGTFTGSGELSAFGVVSGAGHLEVVNSTLGLINTNTYAGGTGVNGGLLVIGRAASLGTGDLTLTNATLSSGNVGGTATNAIVLSGSNAVQTEGGGALTLSGNISGDGSLNKTGGTTLALTTSNAYTGGTTVGTGGALIYAANGALGTGDLTLTNGTISTVGNKSIFSNVVLTGTGTFTGAGGDLSLFGNVSGAGHMEVVNSTLNLVNPNTYAGGTGVNGGTLVVGITGAMGSGGLTLTNGSLVSSFALTVTNTVVLSGSNVVQNNEALTLSGLISGDGSLTKTGSSTLTIANTNNSYTGDTTVQTGRLQGTGNIGGNLINATDGTIAPGNSIGTMTVGGNFDQAAGTLEVEIAPTGTSHDILAVTGSSALTGGTVNVVQTAPGIIHFTNTADIITTGAGATLDAGNVTVTDTNTLVQYTLTTDGSSIFLFSGADQAAFVAAATTPNNKIVAGALATDINGGLGNDLFDQLQLDNNTQYNRHLEELSPERFQAAAVVNVHTAQAFNNNLFQASNQAGNGGVAALSIDPMQGLASVAQDPALLASVINSGGVAATAPVTHDPVQVFARGYGVFNNTDSDTDRTGFRANTGGGLFGVDVALSQQLTVGVAVGYANTEITFDQGLGSVDDDTVRGGPFVSFRTGALTLDAAATFGYHWESMDTTILGAAANADYEAWDFTAYGRAGYDIKLGDSLTVTPFAAIQYVYFHQDSFTQSGPGGLVNVDSNTFDSLRSTLGARLACTTHLGSIAIVPEISGGWAHEFLSTDDTISGSFIGGATPFTVNTTGVDENAFLGGAGVTALLSDKLSVYVRYDGEFSTSTDIHTISGGVAIRF